jgi:uncharacterized membrane protein
MAIAPYRKLVAVIVGLLITWLAQHWPLLGSLSEADTAELVGAIVEAVMYGLTALAVWWFPNQQTKP